MLCSVSCAPQGPPLSNVAHEETLNPAGYGAVIAGPIIGSAVIGCIVFWVCFGYRRKKKRQQQIQSGDDLNNLGAAEL